MKTQESIQTDQAPSALGPYSQAIGFGELVFASGQGGLDPESGQLVAGGVAEQTEQVMQNLQAVLQAAGSGLEHALKATIFLRYIKDFAAVNEVYARHIGEIKPARSTVAVSALPLGALVEIEMIALVPQAAETLAPKQKDKKKGKGKKGKGKKKNK